MAEVNAAERGTAGYVDPLRGLWTEAGAASGTDAVTNGRAKNRGRFLHFVVPFLDMSSPALWASGIRGIQATAFQVSNANLTAWCGFTTDTEAQQGTLQLRQGVVFGPPPSFTGWVHLWVQPGRARASNLPTSTATPAAPFNTRQGLVVHGATGLPTRLYFGGTYLSNREHLVHRVIFVPAFSSNDTLVLGTKGIAATALQLANLNHRASVRVANTTDAAQGRLTFSLGLNTIPAQPIAGWVHTWSRS